MSDDTKMHVGVDFAKGPSTNSFYVVEHGKPIAWFTNIRDAYAFMQTLEENDREVKLEGGAS